MLIGCSCCVRLRLSHSVSFCLIWSAAGAGAGNRPFPGQGFCAKTAPSEMAFFLGFRSACRALAHMSKAENLDKLSVGENAVGDHEARPDDAQHPCPRPAGAFAPHVGMLRKAIGLALNLVKLAQCRPRVFQLNTGDFGIPPGKGLRQPDHSHRLRSCSAIRLSKSSRWRCMSAWASSWEIQTALGSFASRRPSSISAGSQSGSSSGSCCSRT